MFRLTKLCFILLLLAGGGVGAWYAVVYAPSFTREKTRTPQPPPALPPPTGEFFPMTSGTQWEYEGTVAWSDNKGPVPQAVISWKMELLSRHKVGAFEAAIVRGHPADLAWYEPGKTKPSVCLIVRSPRGRYFRIAPFDAVKDAGLLKSPKLLADRCLDETLFAFPGMRQGATWGADATAAPRTDGFHRWNIEAETPARTAGGAPVTVYTLAYRTNPDHQLAEFAPGIGLVRWQYVHHGTVAECDMRLVKFTPGGKVAQTFLSAQTDATVKTPMHESSLRPARTTSEAPRTDRNVCATLPAAWPRVIHLFVALCDNASQGIVPVPAAVGDGDRPEANLYWGCADGAKTVFGRSKTWKLVEVAPVPGGVILDRRIYRHATLPGVWLVADAWRGREIKQAVQAFLKAAAGKPADSAMLGLKDGTQLPINAGAALVAYIGHDGLMDFELPPEPATATPTTKPAIVLCCKSRDFFGARLKKGGAVPLLCTTQLMYPGAFILRDSLDAWLAGKGPAEIRAAAARAYATNQKITEKAAGGIFCTP